MSAANCTKPASAGAMATARWRQRRAGGRFVVAVELGGSEVGELVRSGFLPHDKARNRAWIRYALQQLVRVVLGSARPAR